jgi:hypothetical protein
MGVYVNPRAEPKLHFLKVEGVEIENKEAMDYAKLRKDFPDCLLVVYVENPTFSAAGVVYSKREHEEFVITPDSRPRRFFLVETKKLFDVCDREQLQYALERAAKEER